MCCSSSRSSSAQESDLLRLMTGSCLHRAAYVTPEVCRLFPPSGKSQMGRFLMTTPPKPKWFWSSAVVRLFGAAHASRRRSRRGRISSEESYVFAFRCDAVPPAHGGASMLALRLRRPITGRAELACIPHVARVALCNRMWRHGIAIRCA